MSYYSDEVERIHASILPRKDVLSRIVMAKRFIDSHYHEPITVDTVARIASTSKFHFIRQFKRLYGRSPWQYLTEVRNHRAKELLLRGCSVQDACVAVGYDSLTTFSHLFKRMTGSSPAKLRCATFDKR